MQSLRDLAGRVGIAQAVRKLRHLGTDLALLPRKHRMLSEYPQSSPGSEAWLVGTELKYGGVTRGVPRSKVSPHDPRTLQQLQFAGMSGGDRMLVHGYAAKYAEYLRPFLDRSDRLTIAEFGILTGIGLAIWCDLFPHARVLGFDIDLSNCKGHMPRLRQLGAFQRNEPELYEYDQFVDNREYLGGILGDDRIVICIDDGFHSEQSILTTADSVRPYLAQDFVYFIEDNRTVHRSVRDHYSDWAVDADGELTIAIPDRARPRDSG
jgi:hypothetical protein